MLSDTKIKKAAKAERDYKLSDEKGCRCRLISRCTLSSSTRLACRSLRISSSAPRTALCTDCSNAGRPSVNWVATCSEMLACDLQSRSSAGSSFHSAKTVMMAKNEITSHPALLSKNRKMVSMEPPSTADYGACRLP